MSRAGGEFSVRPGDVFGLLGPNRAGKATTLNILYTLLRPGGGDGVRAIRGLIAWTGQASAARRTASSCWASGAGS
ncbi:ATP-binding cassette domain-containing protein [Actinomadura madurae]|uniref:ATP-binding cassette domain-containing protein n=1 Tax=Actinomadura madurae TaxID=1993 RepID=UPI003558948B